MSHLFIFFTYNRPVVLRRSLESFFRDKYPEDSEFLIINDGFDSDVLKIINECREKFGAKIIQHDKNYGYSYSFYEALNLTIKLSPEFVFFIETDYVFRKGFYDDCLKALKNTQAVGIPGSSHPDFYKPEAYFKWYGDVTKEQFGQDIPNRKNLYKHFQHEDITVQYGTHACCCFMLNWKKFIEKVRAEKYLSGLFTLMDRACEKYAFFGVKTPNDGMITGGISLLWATMNGYNEESDGAAFIDIVNPPIAIHIAGGGINATYLPENETSIIPPFWENEYYN